MAYNPIISRDSSDGIVHIFDRDSKNTFKYQIRPEHFGIWLTYKAKYFKRPKTLINKLKSIANRIEE